MLVAVYKFGLYICQKEQIGIFQHKYQNYRNEQKDHKMVHILNMEPSADHLHIFILLHTLHIHDRSYKRQHHGYTKGFQQTADQNQDSQSEYLSLLLFI